jgi:sulfur oxygenase/reductase
MGDQLSHIWIDQLTYWDSWEAHEDFHETFEDVVVDTCARCGDILLEGPEEPIYRIVHSDLPKLISMNQWLRKSAAGESEGCAVDSGQSATVMATHRVRPGGEEAFEAGEAATLDKLKESTGMVGYQILKRIGISTLGSGHATVESLSNKLKAIPGSKLERTADVWEGYPLPAEYLVVVEWESLGGARGGMPHVNVKPELLRIHGPKVLDNCLQLPAVRMADSMFREQTYREILSQSQR